MLMIDDFCDLLTLFFIEFDCCAVEFCTCRFFDQLFHELSTSLKFGFKNVY